MKKRLFNEYESYTEQGGKVSDEFQAVINPILKKWANEGYSIKDIEAIAMDTVALSSCLERSIRAIKRRKKELEIK